MKNKKKVKLAATDTVVAGVFKKRSWPWLFVIAGAILAACYYIIFLVEFLGPNKKCPETCCDNFYNYTFHYGNFINTLWIIVGVLVLIAILCALIFIRKRSLVVTDAHIIYTNGRKTRKIPLSTVESIDTGISSVIVRVPFKKFKFAKLKNKKEVYDALLNLLQTPATVVTETVKTSIPAIAATTVSLPTTTEGKIRYFQTLLATGVITPEQFKKYTNTVFTTDFPSLYTK